MKKVLCIILSAVMICCSLISCVFTNAYDDTAEFIDQEVFIEQKVSCAATLADEFADDTILIVLNHEESMKFKEYSTGDFSGVDCKSISDLSSSTEELVKNKVDKINIGQTESLNLLPRNDFAVCVDTNAYHKILCLELKNAGKENVLKAIKQIEKRADVLYACPNYIVSIDSADAVSLPSDTYYNYQSSVASMIGLPEAWNITTGSSTVTVGVLDTGIDANHTDLTSRVNNALSRNFLNEGGKAVTEPYDNKGHGTHVAGIIGAHGNNSAGITGVCWNVRLVNLQVLNSYGSGEISSVVEAINYATKNNIKILNISASWTSAANSSGIALDTAIMNYPGLVVCSAGNGEYVGGKRVGKDLDTVYNKYPAEFNLPNLITVGSCSSSAVSGFSNYGKTTVNIFAPGENILSCSTMSLCEEDTCSNGEHFKAGYHYNSGTSMAAPFVTGVAALLLAKYPTMTAAELKHTILGNVDMVYDSAGHSIFSIMCTSGGRLNAYKALSNPIYGDHSYVYTNVSLTAGHNAKCAACGETYLESHSWVEYSTYYRCSKCKIISGAVTA